MKPSTLTELGLDHSLVISKLETILGPELPSIGTIAGPGLAALLLSHIWKNEIHFERFDHYVDSLDEPVSPTAPIRYSRPGFSEEDDFSTAQNGFSIMASEHRGRITRHLIQRCRPGFGKQRVLHILYALDLNAFGVGFDCYSKRLVVTDAFTEFARTRQLRIQSPVSAESLLNLVKFREIFGCYADIVEEMELLIGFRSYCIGRGEDWAYDNSVCAQGKAIYDLHRNELAQYSLLVELDDPVFPGLEELMEIRCRLEFSQDNLRDQHGPITQLISSSIYQLDSYAFSVFYDRCIRKCISKTQLKRFLIALKYPATAYMVLFNPDCLNYDFNEKHADEINQFYGRHHLCVRVLMEMHLDIISTAQAIRKIQAFARKNGNQVIGLVEMHNRMGCHLEKINDQALNELLSAYRTLAGRPLISNPVDLRTFEYREYVSELTTTTDLECEGWKMRNCVGGYANEVLSNNGNLRIFHFDGQKPSTVAIYYNKFDHSFSTDTAGLANSEPAEEHMMITESLGRFLLTTVWNKEHDEQDE